MRRATSLIQILRAALIAMSIVVLAVLAGCGGGGDSNSTTAAAGTGGAGSINAATASRSLSSFGHEASAGDQGDAAKAFQEFLRATADGDAAKQCSLMASSTKQTLQEFGGGLLEVKERCTELIAAVNSQIQAKALAQPGRIRVTGMRVNGERGFVLYRDQRGNDFAFAVIREGSAWKVGGLTGYRLQ